MIRFDAVISKFVFFSLETWNLKKKKKLGVFKYFVLFFSYIYSIIFANMSKIKPKHSCEKKKTIFNFFLFDQNAVRIIVYI
jgi:hypothetical protein